MRSEGNVLHAAVGSVADAQSIPDSLIAAAYELTSPLVLVRQLALELQSGAADEVQQHEIAQQLQLVAEKSLRLSSDVTVYNKLQTTLFVNQPLNVRELVRDVCSEAHSLYEARGRTLVIRRTVRQPLVNANYDLLRRIVLNFIDNALEYSDSNGVVELYTQLVGGKELVRLGVRDYGPALPRQLWQSIQSGYLSPQPVHARPTTGGIGLRIACEFAAATGAKIGATRHRDGASFFVDVPISKQLSLL